MLNNYIVMENLFSILLYVQMIEVILTQQYFRVKPHDTSVVAGKTAELHCHIGNRAGHVQWSKDGFLLGYDPKIPGYERYEMRVDHSKSAYTLLVHEASLDDEAEFQCQVGPGKNEKPIRSVARLTVLVPPKHLSINDLPNGSEIEVREAEKVILVCQAVSSKPATILKWYRKSIELMPEASRTTVRREGEKLYSTLSSITLYPKDTTGASYTCEALHPALEKTLKTSVTVGVLYPPGHPEIVGFREGDILHAGDHLTLLCSSAGGKPPARLTWYRNAELMEGSYSTVGRDASNTISFTVRDTDNNAAYSCAATNPLTPRSLVKMVRVSVLFPPSRVIIEGPTEVGRGETATLNCKSDPSNPPAEVAWLVDGVSFEPQDTMSHAVDNGWYTSSNLTATITRQDKDVKVFTCLAHGSPSHEKVFQNFNISVVYPPDRPQITGYEEMSELREGEWQTFTCSASAGNPPADLRWYRGDYQVPTPIDIVSGHVSSILTLQIEPSDNELTVRCEVNNSASVDPLSTETKMSVLFPPPNVTISIDPQQPKEGEEVRLECWSGTSNPAAKIFWWRDGALMQGKQNQVETTDSAHGGSSTRSSINFPVTSAEHGSRFSCEAKNDAFQRSVREQVTLHVLYAPIFITPGKVVDVVEGRPGEVNMTTRANPSTHTYRWSRGGVQIPSRSDNFRESPRVSADGAALYFSRVSRHDAGAYTCVAHNLQGSASATLTLNVLYPGTVTNVSGTMEAAEGDSAHLECTAEGNPLTEDSITWRMSDDHEQTLVAYSPEVGHSILTIVNVTRKDGGVIECVADNGIGSAFSSVTRLIVLYRPIILRNMLQRRVATGERESAELNCIADGHPDVTFAWSFNGSTIGISRADGAKYRVQEHHKTDQEWLSTLAINAITQGDYGVYTCIAGNPMGHDFVTFNVIRRSIPDPPEHLEALNVSHQAALLKWTPGFDGGLPQSFLLKVRKNQEASFAIVHIPFNSTSFLVTGLLQGTQYELSIAAKNGIGPSLYTDALVLRTKSLPVMDSTISRPDSSSGSTSMEFLPGWLLAAAVIGSLVVMANVLVCVIYIRRKRWCHTPQAAAGSQDMDDDISREKMAKKIPSEEHSPFYLTGTSVDMPDDGLDLDSFQKAPNIRQVSRESSEDGHSSGRRCDCGGRQWSSTLICGGRPPGENRTGNQHEQCPDILKRDSCHCHASAPAGQRISEAEIEVPSTLGAVMYGKHERQELPSDVQDYPSRDQLNTPQITLTTFQSKSELPIRRTIIGPKLETVINGHDSDS